MSKSRRSESTPSRAPAKAPSKAAAARQAGAGGARQKASEVRSSYLQAVGIYESAVGAFHRRDFATAATQLRKVLSGFPGETELVEWARLHLAACERRLSPPSNDPRSTGERLYAATMALNDGKPERALSVLEPVADADPQADATYYLRAVAETERGAFDRAIASLERAIGRNPSYRSRARVDPDLAPLRQLDDAATLLEARRNDAPDAQRPSRTRR